MYGVLRSCVKHKPAQASPVVSAVESGDAGAVKGAEYPVGKFRNPTRFFRAPVIVIAQDLCDFGTHFVCRRRVDGISLCGFVQNNVPACIRKGRFGRVGRARSLRYTCRYRQSIRQHTQRHRSGQPACQAICLRFYS